MKRGDLAAAREAEIAKLALIMRELPGWVLCRLSAQDFIQAFGVLHLSVQSVSTIKKQVWATKPETKPVGKKDESVEWPPPDTLAAQQALERITRVVTKTYPHLGDAEEIGSEEGLRLVYGELKRHDPAMIKRNERRAIPKN